MRVITEPQNRVRCCSKFSVVFHSSQRAAHSFTTPHFPFYLASSPLFPRSHTAGVHFRSYCKRLSIYATMLMIAQQILTYWIPGSAQNQQLRPLQVSLKGELQHALSRLPRYQRGTPTYCAQRSVLTGQGMTSSDLSGMYVLERTHHKGIFHFGLYQSFLLYQLSWFWLGQS